MKLIIYQKKIKKKDTETSTVEAHIALKVNHYSKSLIRVTRACWELGTPSNKFSNLSCMYAKSKYKNSFTGLDLRLVGI